MRTCVLSATPMTRRKKSETNSNKDIWRGDNNSSCWSDDMLMTEKMKPPVRDYGGSYLTVLETCWFKSKALSFIYSVFQMRSLFKLLTWLQKYDATWRLNQQFNNRLRCNNVVSMSLWSLTLLRRCVLVGWTSQQCYGSRYIFEKFGTDFELIMCKTQVSMRAKRWLYIGKIKHSKDNENDVLNICILHGNTNEK